jgi:hypothetical protein
MASTVALQINQDGFVNLAGHMNLWGTLYAKQDMYCERTAYFRNDIEIRPTVLNTQAGIFMRGGSISVDNFWYVGRGAYNVGRDNFVIGSNMIAEIYNGTTQPFVGFQLNTDRTAYFTGKVFALDGLEVRNQNLKVFAAVEATGAGYFQNLFVSSVNINDIYQTRPWISIRVVYTAATQGISVVNRGRVSIQPNSSSGNSIGWDSNASRWSIVWTDAHPHGDEYIAQYCLYSTIGFIHSGYFDNKTFIMITKNSSGTQTPLSFNLTIF